MKEITTRHARALDAPKLVEMIRELAAQHGDNAQITEEELVFLCFGPTPWQTVIVAECGGQVVGYVAMQRRSQLQLAKRAMDVHHLFVDSDMRGRGVGRALIEAASAFAELNRCHLLMLGVMEQNERAHGFYERLGFDHKQGSPALQMTRELGLRSA